LLAAIVLVAAAIRLPALVHDGLWRDEANVYIDVIAPTFSEFIHRVTEIEWHPPLYFLITYAWVRLTGTSELSFVILPFLLGIATVLVVYALGKKVAGVATGLLAAAMYAIAPIEIAYSSEYVYPLATLLFTLLAWVVFSVEDAALTPRRFVGVALVTLLVMYTHYVALFYVPMLIAWAFLSRGAIKQRILLATAIGTGALSFLVWLPVFLSQRRIGVPYGVVSPVLAKVAFFIMTLQQMSPFPAPFSWLPLPFVIVGLVILLRSRPINRDAVAVGALFFVALFLISAADILAVRYVIPFYGLLCVFLAWTIAGSFAVVGSTESGGGQRLGVVVASLACVAIGFGEIAYVAGTSSAPKSGIRTFIAAKPLDPATLYMVAPDYLAPTFAFYTQDDPVSYTGFVRTSRPQIFSLAGYGAEWRKSNAVDNGLLGVADDAHRYTYLDLIVDEYAKDNGAVPYGKVWTLLNLLKARYPLISQTRYAGRDEPISVYRFALNSR
jgi:4-amino-4-deoxy-L-arabinose transferase-like glycosyltransferase